MFFFCCYQPATTQIYTYLLTLSLHDALPILVRSAPITSLIMTQLFLVVSLSLLVPPPYPTSIHFPVQAMMRQGGRGCNAARTRALPVNPTPPPRQYSRPPTRPDR